jgi:ribosomal protein S18 acetylase RimI-like enzyme
MARGHVAGTSDGERWLVADDREAVGVAYAAPEQMTEGTWNLYLIAVRTDRHGRGYGTMLMRTVEAALVENGQRVLLVETSALPTFERTRAFYHRLGYRRVAVIPEFYRRGEDKIVFWKALTRSGTPA